MLIVDPKTGAKLVLDGDCLTDRSITRYPVIDNVPRLAGANYTENFGFQWNKFSRTQLDENENQMSRARFFAETAWTSEWLAGKDVLEVGSGAGRFSKVVLQDTLANLWSIDYSDAVSANWKNNGQIAPERFHLYQASVYEMPFRDGSFDAVFCLGVLQHTPDFAKSVEALVRKAKVGAPIVVDFYPINGWWTKVHAKYLLRPFAKRLKPQQLLAIIERNVGWLLKAYDALRAARLGVLTRFLPLTDASNFPASLSPEERREWAVLDTFDGFSPEYDQPQRLQDVVAMFEKAGASVTFAGRVPYQYGCPTVVRAVRRHINTTCQAGRRAPPQPPHCSS